MSENTMENKVTEQDSAKTKPQELLLCPCCGKETLPKPVKLPADICDSYMACILTDHPFTREYNLYDGRLQLLVTMPSTAIANRLRSLGYLLGLATRNMSDSTKMAADEYMTAVMQLVQIRTITVKSQTDTRNYPVQECVLDIILQMEDILKERLKVRLPEVPTAQTTEAPIPISDQDGLLTVLKALALRTFDASTFSSVPRTVLARVIDKHNELFAILLDQGFDDDFWAGIRLG